MVQNIKMLVVEPDIIMVQEPPVMGCIKAVPVQVTMHGIVRMVFVNQLVEVLINIPVQDLIKPEVQEQPVLGCLKVVAVLLDMCGMVVLVNKVVLLV